MKWLLRNSITIGATWLLCSATAFAGWIPIEQFTVDSAQAAPTFSSSVLAGGQPYRIEVSGFYRFNMPWYPERQADAEYGSDNAFGSIYNLTNGSLDLLILHGLAIGTPYFNPDQGLTAQDVDWGPYNPSHDYAMEITGNDETIGFVISDLWQPGSFGEQAGVFDNVGSLTVTINQIPEPGTIVLLLTAAVGGAIAYFSSRRRRLRNGT